MKRYLKIFSIQIILFAIVFLQANDDIPRSIGNGFPGVVNKLKSNPDMEDALTSAEAILFSYTRAQIPAEIEKNIAESCPTNSIAFIAHQPKKLGKRMLPFIVEFKIVPDNQISPSYINTKLFSSIKTEKLTDFVKKDFVAMSILVPKSLKLKSGLKGERSEPGKLVMDAIINYYRQIGNGTINTNQMFVVVEDVNAIDDAFDFYVQNPNKFTMFLVKDAIPTTSSLNNFSELPNTVAIYYPNNAGAAFLQKLDSFKYRIDKSDGKFELLEYDESLQNGWDNPQLIKWLLEHTTDGIKLSVKGKKGSKIDPKNPPFVNGVRCTTSEEISSQKKFWPQAAVDGDEKTYFQSENMVKNGGWLMAEFEKPIKGKVAIKCGVMKRRKLEHLYGNMRVEISADGNKWQQRGMISKKDGDFSYIENTGKIRFVRIISHSPKEIMLVVREITVEEL